MSKRKWGQLSGGEKVRLELCRISIEAKFLILDEPTNHMDLAGKEALEKMLTSYEGTVLFVSHDRYFINQVATGILEFGESDVQFYGMNYAQYLEEIKRQTPGRETEMAGAV
ncbi:MAG: ATP-binding cassette domain-containing protein [Fusicatenibacter saccharivorans]